MLIAMQDPANMNSFRTYEGDDAARKAFSYLGETLSLNIWEKIDVANAPRMACELQLRRACVTRNLKLIIIES